MKARCKCGRVVPVIPGLKHAVVSHVTRKGHPCDPNGWHGSATATGAAKAYANWDNDAMWDLGPPDYEVWP